MSPVPGLPLNIARVPVSARSKTPGFTNISISTFQDSRTIGRKGASTTTPEKRFREGAFSTPQATFIWISARDFHYSGSFGGISYGFELARELSPSILFIEDVDNWLDSYTVDMIKTEMDGIRRYKGVTTILTTNFPELLPEALIDRPGRFHDVLKFGLPSDDIRGQMLARWIPALEGDAKAKAVTETKGMSGAHIKELANFAAAIQADENCTVAESVEKALAKIKEQRELIDKVQLQGSNYRPHRNHEAVIKKGKKMSFLTKAAQMELIVKAEDEKPKEDEKPADAKSLCGKELEGGGTCGLEMGHEGACAAAKSPAVKEEEVKPEDKPEQKDPMMEESVTVPMLKDVMDGMDMMEFGEDATDEMRDRHKMVKNMLKGCHGKMQEWRKGVKDMADGMDMCGVMDHTTKSVGDVHMLCGQIAEEMERMCRMENLPEALRSKGEELMEHVGMIKEALGGYVKKDDGGMGATGKEDDEEDREEKEEDTDDEKANENDEEPLESMQDAIPGDPNEQYGKEDEEEREEKVDDEEEREEKTDGDGDEDDKDEKSADDLAGKVADLVALGVEFDTDTLMRLKELSQECGYEGAVEMILDEVLETAAR